MSAEPQRYDAFLAYNSQDRAFATELKAHLEDLRLKIWFDADHPDNTFAKQSAALRTSNFFLCLKGKHPFGHQQYQEWDIALKLWGEREGTANELGFTLINIPDYKVDEEYEDLAEARFYSLDFTQRPTKRQIHALASRIKQDIMPPVAPPVMPKQNPCDFRIFTLTGGSGAGIGEFCDRLSTDINLRHGSLACRVLSMDRYYIGLPSTRSRVTLRRKLEADYDQSSMIDLDQLAADIASLRAGHPIEAPIYDKKTHATVDFQLFEPPQLVLLVEGTRVFQTEELRRLSDVRIHVDVDAEIRFLRRMWKDIDKHDVTPERAFRYYRKHVRPAYAEIMKYVQEHANHTEKIDPSEESVNIYRDAVNLDFGSAVASLCGKLGI